MIEANRLGTSSDAKAVNGTAPAGTPSAKTSIRDRIRELRRVKASELVPNPKNWRRRSKPQAEALRGL